MELEDFVEILIIYKCTVFSLIYRTKVIAYWN
ncbi:hypothetical protein SAMN05216302_100161 [Nitrosomonas aestuarii]|uniref:Uncharacterized protein n=1 Tax=Nitrosomonas aestuarii TaxID=52441 RepID=A0A1I3X0S7_9PROT|nr:hypothetical protein SAMN05216302_100161 [Nitrosomonas aestuarii]